VIFIQDARKFWRQSLQFRVSATTFITSLLVITLLGWLLLSRISSGVLTGKETQSSTEAKSAFSEAQRIATATDTGAGTVNTSLIADTIVSSLAIRAGQAGLYEILLLSPSEVSTGSPERGTNLVAVSSISEELKTQVENSDKQLWMYSTINYLDGREIPGLIYGAPISVAGLDNYLLFLLFPLTQEQQTLAIVQSAVVFTGFLLVFLLVGVVSYVTGEVLRPVRTAAQAAEKLRLGLLSERVPVTGEDDLATLSMSFNSMADSLQQQIMQLEQLSSMQRRFVSDVSHELRTPLTTVRMAADVLYEARENYDGEVARSAELLSNQLERFESLLSELLEISRFDAKVAELELSQVNLAKITNQVADSLAGLIQKRNSPLKISGESPEILADSRRIERIIRNLLSNAIEYGAGSPIEITFGSNETAVAMVVKDFGHGLKPEEAKLIFNRFFRSDPARARAGGGTGLGLSIALEDAKLHAGWIDATGAPGKGAMFRLTLPRELHQQIFQSPLILGFDENATYQINTSFSANEKLIDVDNSR
jgi:two-component system, OmpR family, sensor histidine kinase MtrB